MEAGWYLGSRGLHPDPVDRMLYATAHHLNVPLVTKDRRLQKLAATAGDVRVIW
ncbi:MAG: PIN domain-containing protein [Acidimicrobiia bacterium]